MGRGTMGVHGISLPVGAEALGLEIAREDSELLVITEKGYGKRTPIEEYPTQHRGGQGVFTINMTAKKGMLADVKVVNPGDEIIIMSEDGLTVRTPVSGISQQGRSTQGVHIMNVADEDRVSVIAISKRAKKRVHKNELGQEEIEADGKDEMSEEDLDD